MPVHNENWKCKRAQWVALSTCAIEELLQHADVPVINHLSSALADMTTRARNIQDPKNWVDFWTYCKNKIRQLCTRHCQANTGYLEKTMNCIEGLIPISQHMEELMKQRVESWRPILLCTEESNLERDIHTRLVQIHAIRGYFVTALCGRRSDERCTPDLQQTHPDTY